MEDENKSLIEWYRNLYPSQKTYVAGHTVAAALGAILAYLLYNIIPDDFPIHPFPLLAFGLLLLYLNFRNWHDKWD